MSITRSITRPVTRSITRAVTAGMGGSAPLAYQALLDLNPVLLIPSINDAVAEGRLWQDSAMTTPATAVDHPVGAVEDFSGNAYHLTGSGAARPLLKQDGDGNYYLLYDGVNDALVTGSSVSLTQPFTICVSPQVDASNSCIYRFPALGPLLQVIAPFGNRNDYYAGSHMSAGGASMVGVKAVLSAIFNGAASSSRRDGAVENGATDAGAGAGGNVFTVGNDSGSTPLTGRIYALSIFPSALTSPQLQTVESYMAANSGVTL